MLQRNIIRTFSPFTAKKRLQLLLEKLKEFRFEPAPDFALEDRIPLEVLERWTSLVERPLRHPIARSLNTFIQAGTAYPADVSLQSIGAVSSSKGYYLMHLDRLPETMRMLAGESFGPLSSGELDRLKNSVFAEFGLTNGRFDLRFQEWDQLYIGSNGGASRRFALWRRLTRERQQVQVPANVTPYRINPELQSALRDRYRAIGIKADTKLWSILHEAGSVGVEFAYLDGVYPLSERSWALFLLPYPHLFPRTHLPLALDVHRRVERLFDLGRYTIECMSFAKMKSD